MRLSLTPRVAPAASVLLAAVLAAAPLLLAPSRAAAGEGFGGLGDLFPIGVGFAAGALGQNLAFTVDDILMARRGAHPARADGAFELGFSLPQILGWVAVASTVGTHVRYDEAGARHDSLDPSVMVPTLIGAVWAMALAGHGLWAIATAPDPAPREVAGAHIPARATPLRLSLSPTLLGGPGTFGGGLGVTGTF